MSVSLSGIDMIGTFGRVVCGFRKIQKVHFVQLARAVNGVQVCANGHRARGWSHGLNQAAETARQGHLDHSTLSIPTVPSFMSTVGGVYQLR